MSEEATVVELLPSAAYRLKLSNEDVVVAHAAGPATVNFVRVRPGDRVLVMLPDGPGFAEAFGVRHDVCLRNRHEIFRAEELTNL